MGRESPRTMYHTICSPIRPGLGPYTPPSEDGMVYQELPSPEVYSTSLPGAELLTPPGSTRSSIDFSTKSSHCEDGGSILDYVSSFVQSQLNEYLVMHILSFDRNI